MMKTMKFTKLIQFFLFKKSDKTKTERKFLRKLKNSKISFVEISKPENMYGEKVEGYYYRSGPIELFRKHKYRELFNYNQLIEMDRLGNCNISYYDSWGDIVITFTFPGHRVNNISYKSNRLPLP